MNKALLIQWFTIWLHNSNFCISNNLDNTFF